MVEAHRHPDALGHRRHGLAESPPTTEDAKPRRVGMNGLGERKGRVGKFGGLWQGRRGHQGIDPIGFIWGLGVGGL